MNMTSLRPRSRIVATGAAMAAAALVLAGCSSSTSNAMGGHMMGDGSMMSGSMTGSSPTAAVPAGPVAPLVALPEETSTGGALDVTLTASESQVPYGQGQRWAMTYNGGVSGPTLRVHPGDRLTITLQNNLSKPTSLHTHGLHVSPAQDDPFVMVEPGQSHVFTYDIPVDQQAGTYWYHPHVHGVTAEQVASGLSGAIIVEDDDDAALRDVSTDRVLVVNDPPISDTNPWGDGGGMMGGGTDMMSAMLGRTGPRLLTNGQDGVALDGDSGKLERVHIVNATSSSSLRLSFDGASMWRLSSVGGRLPQAVDQGAFDLAQGERAELVLVPGASGGTLTAQRLSNEGDGAPVGAAEVIASVSAAAGADPSVLPANFKANTRDLFAPDVKVDRTRTITLDGHMNPTIDGKPFDANSIDVAAKKGTVEEWTITSTSPMLHPIHLHSWPFQVKGQNGWTDIVTVPANGTQVIRVAFDDFGGKTVLHCHILDHEDAGMMAVIAVN